MFLSDTFLRLCNSNNNNNQFFYSAFHNRRASQSASNIIISLLHYYFWGELMMHGLRVSVTETDAMIVLDLALYGSERVYNWWSCLEELRFIHIRCNIQDVTLACKKKKKKKKFFYNFFAPLFINRKTAYEDKRCN